MNRHPVHAGKMSPAALAALKYLIVYTFIGAPRTIFLP